MRSLVLGDTHGNGPWLTNYVYPLARRLKVDAIVQVGDFGYWEHTPDGVKFLDDLEQTAMGCDIPIFWLHGNHDKHSMVVQRYRDHTTDEGFLVVRGGVYYIPQGHIWEWEGVRMRAFGGAYSVDKDWRLELENTRRLKILRKNMYRPAGSVPLDADTSETLWFPEEEMSDEDMTRLLDEDSSPVNIVFSHDKPRSSEPGWNRKDFPECWPNQDRLQHALVKLRPLLWFHGHLHHHYVHDVRCGDDDQFTRVIGLGPDNDAAPPNWKRTDSWGLLELVDGGFSYTSGEGVIEYKENA